MKTAPALQSEFQTFNTDVTIQPVFKFGFVPAARLWLGDGFPESNRLTRWKGIFKFGFIGLFEL